MRLQKWLVRSLVFTTLTGMVVAVIVYHHWTDPRVVREQVIQALERKFPGADVTLEAARLRIFGGILLTDLRLVRHDDPNREDFAYIPSGVVFHDKEHLLDGKLSFRKVSLQRPRIKILRGKDGKWNFEGLFSAGDDSAPLPTLVINEGTLIFEDRMNNAELPPLEISGVNLTMINDPLSRVSIEGTGNSRILGRIHLSGDWQRIGDTLGLMVQLKEMQVSRILLQYYKCDCSPHLTGLMLEGIANLDINLDIDPQRLPPVEYSAQCRLKDGLLRHPKIPLPLNDLLLVASLSNTDMPDGKLTLTKLKAISGRTKIEMSGTANLACLDEDFQGKLTVRNLPITKELCARFPEVIQKLHSKLQAEGPVTMALNFAKHKGEWQKKLCTLNPEKVQGAYELFPYRVENIVGQVDLDLLNETAYLDLSAKENSKKIKLQGYWNKWGEYAKVDLHLAAENVTLDSNLLSAMPPKLRKITSSFNPRGIGDFTARFQRSPATGKFVNEYHVKVRDASAKWDGFPYLLQKITGTIEINPGYYEFKNFQGFHFTKGKVGKIQIHGWSLAPNNNRLDPKSPQLFLDISGQGIGIDKDLRAALTPLPMFAKAWDSMGPAGNLDFKTKIYRYPGRPQDMEIDVAVDGCRIEPEFYPYPLRKLSGRFIYANNRLTVKHLKAKHNTTQIIMPLGIVDISPGGGFYADLKNVSGLSIVPDDGFVAALPKALQGVFDFLKLKDPIDIHTDLVIAQSEDPGAQPDVYWDGTAKLRNANFQVGMDLENVTGTFACVGRHNGYQLLGLNGNLLLSNAVLFDQPFKNVHAKMQIKKPTPDILLVGVKAPIYGGDISGQVRVDFHSTVRYEMNMTASQINLEQFGRHNLGEKSQLTGNASGRLHLRGQGTGLSTLDGNGSVDVPRGRLYNLPFLLDLLKFLGLRWPDRTAFEEAHANFAINGERVTINRLDLWGNAISLTGKGNVNLDGTEVDLEFYPGLARVEQLLPPAVRSVSPAVSKNLLKIEVKGKLGSDPKELRFIKRPVPIILDPFLQMRDRFTEIRKTRNTQKSLKMEETPNR